MSATFGTAIIDPPWQYGSTSGHAKLSGYADKQYPLVDEAYLASLPIGRLVSGVVLLWCTAPMVPQGLRLLEGWGFQYVTSLYWYKSSRAPEALESAGEPHTAFAHRPNYGVGYWVRGNTEQVLLARRPGVPSIRTHMRSSFVTKRASHSEKPDTLHRWVEEYGFPAPWLELFARRTREGWTALGNDLDGLDLREAIGRLP